MFLLIFAADVGYVAARAAHSRVLVGAIIAANTAWVAASVAAVVAGWFAITTLGTAVVVLQAGAVAVFAALQAMGLRHTQPSVTV